MLSAAVFCVLLIAITNTASLSLARSADRQREMATRIALGAGSLRLIRQMIAESLTLTFIAGLLGLGIAFAAIHIILAFTPRNLSYLTNVSPDPFALGCTFAVCLVAGILIGLAPALYISGGHVRLAGQERSSSGSILIRRIRRGLVVAEYALAIILLGGTGLLIRSIWLLERVDLGFSPEHVLSAQIALPPSLMLAQRPAIYDRISEELASLPGVEHVGIIENFFISGIRNKCLRRNRPLPGLFRSTFDSEVMK